MTAKGRGSYGVEGLSKKGKRLMGMDHSVAIVRGKGYKGTKSNWKNTIKLKKNNVTLGEVLS